MRLHAYIGSSGMAIADSGLNSFEGSDLNVAVDEFAIEYKITEFMGGRYGLDRQDWEERQDV